MSQHATITPIIEGVGEQKAVPALLARILRDRQRWDVHVGEPVRAPGKGALTKAGGLESYLEVAFRRSKNDGVLVILDADNDCPVEQARNFAERVANYSARAPVAIVLPCRAFETWFLASAETMLGALGDRPGLNTDLATPVTPESEPNPKRWLIDNMPKGQTYKEAVDQEIFTRRIDLDLAASRSRSFRRLLHAMDELLLAIDASHNSVTPL